MIKKLFTTTAIAAVMAGSASAADLKIGAVNAKTGFMAAYDAPFMQGVHMYIDEANASGGMLGKYPIKLVERDDGSDVQKSVTMTAEVLAENPDISVFITSAIAPGAMSAGSQTTGAGILSAHTIASQPTIPARLGKGSYLVMMSDAHMGGVYAKFATEKLSAKTAYITTSDFDPYTQFLPLYFKEKFEQYGGKVVGQGDFAYDQAEFSSMIADIKALPEEPDVIMAMQMDGDFPIFIQQLRAAGIKSTYLGPDILDQPSVKGLGDVVDGVHYVTMAAGISDDAVKFFDAYEAKHGNADAAYPAMVGYSYMKLVAAAAEKAGSIDRSALLTAFGELEGVDTEIGTVSYKGFGALPNLPVHIMRIENGEGVHVESIKLAVEEIPTPRTE